jgi:Protein of unknown function (DUF1329)
MRMQTGIGFSLGLTAILGIVVSGAVLADEIKPGETLDRGTWQKAEGLLPPEILKHYREGEYANAVVDWPESKYNYPPDFQAATKANEGKFKTGPLGEILSVDSGKQPPYILGLPFPTIDPSDEAAAVKIVWNQFYRFWYFGNLHAESQVNWISPSSLERRTDQDVRFLYYDGVPEGERIPNPQNFLTQQLIKVLTPADLNSTAALTWRYRDPEKRESTWTYVPALRRVRAVSPANRSDGFLGSDMSQDDGPFFDGKPEDFVWKMKGQADTLRLAEEINLRGVSKSRWVPEKKAWDAEWPGTKFLGYMDPAWKGVAWAPTGPSVLAKRRMWVVEGTPRDRYYLFGKLEMYVDAVTYQGAWDRKFDWKGELLGNMQVMAWNPLPFTRPDGKVDYNQGSNMAYQCAENVKLNRATVAGVKSSPTAGFYGRIPFDPSIFDVDALARMGK